MTAAAAMLVLSLACRTSPVRDPSLPSAAGAGDARLVLLHLCRGSVPAYKTGEPDTNPGLDSDAYCFARGHGTPRESMPPAERFKINTLAFLEPFSEGVRNLELTTREFMNPDRTVERWVYGGLWQVIANFGDKNYLYNQTLLPPMGFVALGPGFLAQHYYKEAGDERTTLLVVKNGEEEFYGFH